MADVEIDCILENKEIQKLSGELHLTKVCWRERTTIDVVLHTSIISRKFKKNFYYYSAHFVQNKDCEEMLEVFTLAIRKLINGIESLKKNLPMDLTNQENNSKLNERIFKNVVYFQGDCAELLSMFKEADQILVPFYYAKIEGNISDETFNEMKKSVEILFDDFKTNIFAEPKRSKPSISPLLGSSRPKFVQRAVMSPATFSPCRQYRYTLTRSWAGLAPTGKGSVMFVGLNPSTADETNDDPTIRRCIAFAKSWGYDGLVMTNLFAFRATNPEVMLAHPEPVGAANDLALVQASLSAGIVIAAWGNGGDHLGRSQAVSKLISGLHCLSVTKSGQPAHPLYLAKTCMPVLWKP